MFLNSFSPAEVTFGGSLILTGTATLFMELAGVTPGSQFDRLVVAGAASIAGSLDVDLLEGFSPAAGNSFEIIAAAGGISGTFANESLPPLAANLEWDVVYDSDSVTLQVSSINLPGDYNYDGTVDAADYVVWRKGVGVAPTQDNYNLWRTNFGSTLSTGSGSGATGSDSANGTVPEPAMVVMLIVTAATVSTRRWRTWRVSKLNNA
jgi:hypothetical protein